jgi:hypothetical protein
MCLILWPLKVNNGVVLLGGAAFASVFVEASMGPRLTGKLVSPGVIGIPQLENACLELTSHVDVRTGVEGGLATIINPHADNELFSAEQTLWKVRNTS